MTKNRKIVRHKKRRRANSISSDLLNYRMAAEFLGVSPGTLENWVSSGLYRIPFVKVGRLVRFRSRSLLRWVESRERNADQAAATQASENVSGAI